MKPFHLTIVLTLVLAIAGCDRNDSGAAQPAGGGSAASATAAAEPLPPGVMLATAPEGAKDVSAVKQTATPDAEVVLKGVIAGSAEPIAERRAAFTLADVSLETCDKVPGDTCRTPWDACCATPGSIAAKSVTIQVVGADGKPLKSPLRGVGGLAPLKQVTVKGTVRSVEGEGEKKVVTVDASAIHVKG